MRDEPLILRIQRPMRVPIAVSQACYTGDGQPYITTIIICNDGSIWTDYGLKTWQRLPNIPQDGDSTATPPVTPGDSHANT